MTKEEIKELIDLAEYGYKAMVDAGTTHQEFLKEDRELITKAKDCFLTQPQPTQEYKCPHCGCDTLLIEDGNVYCFDCAKEVVFKPSTVAKNAQVGMSAEDFLRERFDVNNLDRIECSGVTIAELMEQYANQKQVSNKVRDKSEDNCNKVSDEEIYKYSKTIYFGNTLKKTIGGETYRVGFIKGAKWMRNKMTKR